MSLHCPFCKAPEDERIEGTDETGKRVLLVMFDCPFHFRFSLDLVGTDNSMQSYLNEWKLREGDAWLESVGPVMKNRELKNVERSSGAAQFEGN
jgi:hypothetical protein